MCSTSLVKSFPTRFGKYPNRTGLDLDAEGHYIYGIHHLNAPNLIHDFTMSKSDSPKTSSVVEISGRRLAVEIDLDQTTGAATVDGQEVTFNLHRGKGSNPASLIVNGRSYVARTSTDADETIVTLGSREYRARLIDEKRETLAAMIRKSGVGAAGISDLKAPMPGLVVKILVKTGDAVTKGDGLMIIEAMKMENEIRSPHTAKVAKITVQQGQAVDKGQVLICFAG